MIDNMPSLKNKFKVGNKIIVVFNDDKLFKACIIKKASSDNSVDSLKSVYNYFSANYPPIGLTGTIRSIYGDEDDLMCWDIEYVINWDNNKISGDLVRQWQIVLHIMEWDE